MHNRMCMTAYVGYMHFFYIVLPIIQHIYCSVYVIMCQNLHLDQEFMISAYIGSGWPLLKRLLSLSFEQDKGMC